jgi:hypothetical protein
MLRKSARGTVVREVLYIYVTLTISRRRSCHGSKSLGQRLLVVLD